MRLSSSFHHTPNLIADTFIVSKTSPRPPLTPPLPTALARCALQLSEACIPSRNSSALLRCVPSRAFRSANGRASSNLPRTFSRASTLSIAQRPSLRSATINCLPPCHQYRCHHHHNHHHHHHHQDLSLHCEFSISMPAQAASLSVSKKQVTKCWCAFSPSLQYSSNSVPLQSGASSLIHTRPPPFARFIHAPSSSNNQSRIFSKSSPLLIPPHVTRVVTRWTWWWAGRPVRPSAPPMQRRARTRLQ